MKVDPLDEAYLLLNACPKIGPITVRRLLEAFNHRPEAILRASAVALSKVEGMSSLRVQALLEHGQTFNLEKEKEAMEKQGASFVSQQSPHYPSLLREIYDPPVGLYWRGKLTLPEMSVAIVGSRRTTQYGRAVAFRLAKELAERGVCVVSGMARGIDTEAHRGALAGGGCTVAVLGNGLDRIYPPENLSLYKEILAQGAVLSEFPYGRKADRQTFPMRNRIVAGMSQAVIIVESEEKGGSMITAKFAADQGRTVFAVPGRIDQPSAQGCLSLIRDGATLVRSVQDIFDELSWEAQMDFQKNLFSTPQAEGILETKIINELKGGEQKSADELSELTMTNIQDLQTALMLMELEEKIIRNAHGRYEIKLKS